MATMMVWYVDGYVQVVEAAPRQFENGQGSERVAATWLGKAVDDGGSVLTFGGLELSKQRYPVDYTPIEIMREMEAVEGVARVTLNGEQVWPMPGFGDCEER